ncbi:hypothetical protein OM427_30585 [Halomonas sp. 18H]|nr:hypothetical protein [Halomonas sp. 18H]MCW4153851.1 hypothetical protein [Halomonas sp. 18H]
MVFGDSVLNGGNLTGHDELATTLATDDEIFFGNVSAGSWGPANIRGWIETYGFMKADTAIFLLSSHDLYDVPTFAPLNPLSHPTERPASALIEGVQRYLPRYLPDSLAHAFSPPQSQDTKNMDGREMDGKQEIISLLNTARQSGIKACLIQHLTREEQQTGPGEENQIIHNLFAERNVPVLDFGKALLRDATQGQSPYRDNIHINALGQKRLREYLLKCADVAQRPEQV